MNTVWNHSELGQFDFEDDRWFAKVKIPAFKKFTYPTFGRRSGGTYDLIFLKVPFGPKANSDPPSSDEIDIACRILANQRSLVDRISSALWDEFHGRGPTSEFWWDGKIDEIQKIVRLEKLQPLKEADDVKSLLKASQIAIGELEEASNGVLALIAFHSAFEPEHGIGILTDGDVVLGAGYASDGTVERYKLRKKSRSTRRK